MNKVTTINLNGRAYQVEEAGYEVLRKYLDQAAAKLEGNPDKDEIMADFEQAIAEKCGQYLSGGKDVITASEIEAIIAKMGPVETGTAEHKDTTGAAGSAGASSEHPGRRLYRIMEGSWIAGVCNGLAAYLNLSTSWVRLGFLVLTGLTHGFFIIAYAILAFVMPVARTEEDRERAHGQAPFTANEFIEQAKQRYAEFQKNHPHAPATPADPHNKAEWRKWKEEMKDWKRQWKYDRHAEHARRHAERRNAHWAARSEGRRNTERQYGYAGSGFFRFVLGTVVVGLSVIWILAVWSIFATGMVLGFPIVAAAAAGAAGLAAAGGAGAVGLAAHPLWVALIFVSALFYLLALPLKLLIKNSRPWRWGHYSFFNDLVQSIFFVFALYLLLYTARILFPGVGEAWSMVVSSVKAL